MKTNTEKYIDSILDDLRAGIVDKDVLIANFCDKWKKRNRTFYNYFRDAEAKWLKEMAKASEIKAQTFIEMEGQAIVKPVKQMLEKVAEMEEEIAVLKGYLADGFIAKMVKINDKIEEKTEIFGTFHICKIHATIDSKRAEISKLLGEYNDKNKDTPGDIVLNFDFGNNVQNPTNNTGK